MAFKMKGSPAKMGMIKGTAAHKSLLKQRRSMLRQEEDVTSLKVETPELEAPEVPEVETEEKKSLLGEFLGSGQSDVAGVVTDRGKSEQKTLEQDYEDLLDEEFFEDTMKNYDIKRGDEETKQFDLTTKEGLEAARKYAKYADTKDITNREVGELRRQARYAQSFKDRMAAQKKLRDFYKHRNIKDKAEAEAVEVEPTEVKTEEKYEATPEQLKRAEVAEKRLSANTLYEFFTTPGSKDAWMEEYFGFGLGSGKLPSISERSKLYDEFQSRGTNLYEENEYKGTKDQNMWLLEQLKEEAEATRGIALHGLKKYRDMKRKAWMEEKAARDAKLEMLKE